MCCCINYELYCMRHSIFDIDISCFYMSAEFWNCESARNFFSAAAQFGTGSAISTQTIYLFYVTGRPTAELVFLQPIQRIDTFRFGRYRNNPGSWCNCLNWISKVGYHLYWHILHFSACHNKFTDNDAFSPDFTTWSWQYRQLYICLQNIFLESWVQNCQHLRWLVVGGVEGGLWQAISHTEINETYKTSRSARTSLRLRYGPRRTYSPKFDQWLLWIH